MSENAIHGNPEEVLSRIYSQRMASIFQYDNLDIHSRAEFQQWLSQQLDTDQSFVSTYRDDDIGWEEDADLLDIADSYDEDQEQIANLGTDVYGTYLPIHFFFDSSTSFDTTWGIYISEIGIYRLAAALKRVFLAKFGEPRSDSNFLEFAYQILLRHELEHFKIESFALHAELIMGKPLYSRYLMQVYAETYPDVTCLEEGLANATVLNSNKLRDLITEMYPNVDNMSSRWQSVIVDIFFEPQRLKCYRNYMLYDGWHGATSDLDARREAMNYLCNQIIEGNITPKNNVPYYAFPPDNHFLRQEQLVPIHIVHNVDDFSFIRVPTPKKKWWEKFLRELGYYPIDQGRGDHEQWASQFSDLPVVTVNYDKNEVEWGSFKSTLKSLGISIHDFQRWLSSKGRWLPPKLRQYVS